MHRTSALPMILPTFTPFPSPQKLTLPSYHPTLLLLRSSYSTIPISPSLYSSPITYSYYYSLHPFPPNTPSPHEHTIPCICFIQLFQITHLRSTHFHFFPITPSLSNPLLSTPHHTHLLHPYHSSHHPIPLKPPSLNTQSHPSPPLIRTLTQKVWEWVMEMTVKERETGAKGIGKDS